MANFRFFSYNSQGYGQKISLAELHILFSILIIVCTLGVSIVFSVLEYKKYKAEKNYYLLDNGYKLNTAFHEKIKLAENMSEFLAEKIVQSKNFSYENIAFLIAHKRLDIKDDSLAWKLIDFVSPSYEIVADSFHGIHNPPLDISYTNRGWFQSACSKPWSLHFSGPAIGIITKKKILSTGFGVTTEDNHFIGYLSIALYVDKLIQSLKMSVNKNVKFILLDKNNNFILSSDENLEPQNMDSMLSLEQTNFSDKSTSTLQLSSLIKISNNIFTLLVKTEKYPFLFLIGESSESYYGDFRSEIIPTLIKNIVLGIILVLVLLFLSYLVIRPIIQLSKIADDISKGNNVHIPEYLSLEINNLSTHLSNIQNMAKDLRLKQEELQRANENLTKANEFIQSNMSFLSHELRNPISGIIGFAKLLKERFTKPEEKENKEYSEFIYSIAKHQEKQINFFLKLFEFQEKGKKIEDREIDLAHVLESNINMVMHHAYHKKTKIIVKIDPDLPNMIGDDIMIGQMVQNFITNGIKYNKEGGSLEIKAFTRLHNRKKEIVIQFKDTGIGIEKKDLEKLFKKFERIQNSKTEGVMGYGLGLAFAKTCIVAHDGEIDVVSEVGLGTIFTVRFPRSRIIEKDES